MRVCAKEDQNVLCTAQFYTIVTDFTFEPINITYIFIFPLQVRKFFKREKQVALCVGYH